jgi:hypothetical protein
MAIKNKSSRPAKKSKPKTKAKSFAGFAAARSALQKILEPYEKSFQRIPGRSDRYWLETKSAAYQGRPFYFAGVSMNKNYVSFHLVPMYLRPEMAKNISPALSRRRQGELLHPRRFRDLRGSTIYEQPHRHHQRRQKINCDAQRFQNCAQPC